MISHQQKLILVTGPARSGKSEWAEYLAQESGKQVIYVATAMVDSQDQDWSNRIQRHQQRRSLDWQTLEAPLDLIPALQAGCHHHCLLIDSLGTWVANHLSDPDEIWEENCNCLQENLQQVVSDVIFVAEETGWGVVPAYAAGRLFRDRLGTLVRQLGRIANPVYLVTGGHVLNLSTLGHPLPF